MSTQLDEVCKKYGYRTVNVATWRDPNLSVLSGGRGPRSGYKVAPSEVGKPYIPKYKVTYPVPEPTDDEDSGDDVKDEGKEDEPPIDSPMEPCLDDPPTDVEDEPGVEESQQTSVDDEPALFPPGDEAKQDSAEIAEPNDKEEATGETELQEIEQPVDLPETVEAGADLPAQETVESTEEASAEARPEATIGAVGPSPEHSPGSVDTPPKEEEHTEDKKVAFAPGTPEPKLTQRKKKTAKGIKSKKKRVAVPFSELPPDIQALIDSTLDNIPPPSPDLPVAVESEAPVETGQNAIDLGPVETAPLDEVSNIEEQDPVIDIVDPAPETSQAIIDEAGHAQTDDKKDHDAVVDAIVEEAKHEAEGRPEPEIIKTPTEAPESANVEPTALPPPEEPLLEQEITDPEPPPPPPPPVDEPVAAKSSKEEGSKKSSSKKGSKSKSTKTVEPPAGLGIDLPDPPAPPPEANEKTVDTSMEEAKEESTEATDAAVELKSAIPDLDIVSLEDATALDDLLAGLRKHIDKDVEQLVAEPAAEANDDNGGASEPQPADDAAPETDANNEEPKVAANDEAPSPVDSGVASEDDEEDKTVVGEAVDDAPTSEPGEDANVEGEPEITGKVEAADDKSTNEGAEAVKDIAAESPIDADESEILATDDVAESSAQVGDDASVASTADTEGPTDTLEDAGPNNADDEQVVAKPVDDDETAAQQEAGPAESTSLTDDVPVTEKTIEETAEPAAENENAGATSKDQTVAGDNDSALEGGDQLDQVGVTEPPADDSPVGEDAAEPIVLVPVGDLSDNGEPETAPPALDQAKEATKDGDVAQKGAVPDEKAEDAPSKEDSVPEPPTEEAVVFEAVPESEVTDPPQLDPSQADAPPADEMPRAEAADDNIAPGEQPVAPPSPVLSKTSSHGSHKSTHWDRPHQANRLKEVFEAPFALKRPHGHRSGSKDEVIHRGERKHRSHRSSDEKERREQRKLEKRKEEAARVLEEERKKAEERERRRAKHEARRAAKKAAEEDAAKNAREEAQKAAEKDAERRRRRRQEREEREIERNEQALKAELRERKSKDRERRDDDRSSRASREPGTSMSTTSRPPMTKVFSGESVHRTGFFVTVAGNERPASRHSKEAPRSPRLERSKTSPASIALPPESVSGDSKSSRRRRRHADCEGEEERSSKQGGSRRGGDGEHRRRRRPTLEAKEKPRSFLGSLLKRS